MRLTKPTLMPFHPILSDPRDVCHLLTDDQTEKDIAKPRDLDYFGVSDLLTLPQNFGNIFLGETFSSYISVHNDSNQNCSDILLKADLQTSSQRLILTGVNSQPMTTLKPNESIDDVIQHEVKELGTHILVCAVSYSTEAGEKMAFRKFFKFQVLKPLDVKTKFYNAECDDVYLEVQIQNITPGPVYMEHVRLDPSNLYNAEELNSKALTQGNGNVFGPVDYLNAMDTRQYLYCLTPRPELYEENKVLKGVTNIGKLDIVWKTNLGEKGRLQTSQLLRVAPGYGDIRVTVETAPDSAPLEETVQVLLKITNCCEREMDLTMLLQNDLNSGLIWCGLSGRKLGVLPPNEGLDLTLNLVTLYPGLQTISGLRLTDNKLKRTYEHDEIAQVFVYNDEEPV
ncbi:trafficking protein particle complex subunit 13-like isoform X2 [Mya arenaria]|nr:trafficking protein particle complex subunit 13-like isoform X2 [Mya arenaria]XP_052774764.1 trafficking protein particle complex subunit 13-like isoform X2 [Mya arenaria]